MAFDWLSARRSSYGSADSDETRLVRKLVAGGVAILIVGVLIGVGGKTLFSGSPASAVDQSVAGPDVGNEFKRAPKTEDGALRVMTSYITGFPSVALQSTDAQRGVLDTIVAPNADPSLRNDLARILVEGRNRVVGAGSVSGEVSTRILTTPASYRVDKLSEDSMRVRIWFNTTAIDSNGPRAETTWATLDARVQWSDHWRIAANTVNGGPNPKPVAGTNQASSYDEVAKVFSGFKSYRQAAHLP